MKIEGTYQGGKGTTPVTTACPEDHSQVKPPYELSWNVKVILKNEVYV